MMHSMTGYGAAKRVDEGVVYTLEIRSLNGRYLKTSIKLPDFLQFAEVSIERLLKNRLSRGNVSCILRAKKEDEQGVAPINTAALQRYVDELCKVKTPAGVEPTINLAGLISLPGVCEGLESDEEYREHCQKEIEALANEAIDSLLEMRKEEGRVLRADLIRACDAIRTCLKQVVDRAPTVIEEYHQRLNTRVARLTQKASLELEADGLMREVAIYAERSDISEEVTRLTSHLDQFLVLCDQGDQVGRKLDFLTQELLREANTIASKSNDETIAHCVVEIKSEIDRLKEQVQNVE